jgi:hypothetical protein
MLGSISSALPPLRYILIIVFIVAMAIELPTILQLVFGLQNKYNNEPQPVDAAGFRE